VFDDFAIEARARVTKSVPQGRFGLQYAPTQGETFSFVVNPSNTFYTISRTLPQQPTQTLITRRTAALKPVTEDNLLRLEVRGDTARFYVNSQQIEQVQHEGLKQRGGLAGMLFLARDPMENREAEGQFGDFKLFSLAP